MDFLKMDNVTRIWSSFVGINHRIIDDRIEKSMNGRQIRHNLHRPDPTDRVCRSGVKGEWGRAGTALTHPPTAPIPHAWPGMG